MKLRTVHQILIVSAGALATIFALRAFLLFTRDHRALDLVLAIVAAGVAGAASTYWRHFRRKR